MYRSRDANLGAIEREEARAVIADDQRRRVVTDRRRELIRLLEQRPLSAVIPSMYAADRDLSTVSADMVGWVLETSLDPDKTLAEAMFSILARTRLVERYAQARAERDAEKWLGARGHEVLA